MTRILITGGNGLIGSHLAERLLHIGYQVHLVDRVFSRNSNAIDCPKTKCDLTDYNSFEGIPTNHEIIFHAAAVSRVAWGEADPPKLFKVNVVGGLNLIQWVLNASANSHVIFASSREVYGEPRDVPVIESHPKNPLSAYGISKLAMEQLLIHFGQVANLRFTITRFSNVYGSTRDLPVRVIPKFVAKALKNEPIILNGGNQILDFTHVQDTVDGLVSLVKKVDDRDPGVQRNDFHFTTNIGCSISELASIVKRITGSRSRVVFKGANQYDVQRFIGDYSKAKMHLGYVPRVELKKGLKSYIEEVMAQANRA